MKDFSNDFDAMVRYAEKNKDKKKSKEAILSIQVHERNAPTPVFLEKIFAVLQKHDVDIFYALPVLSEIINQIFVEATIPWRDFQNFEPEKKLTHETFDRALSLIDAKLELGVPCHFISDLYKDRRP